MSALTPSMLAVSLSAKARAPVRSPMRPPPMRVASEVSVGQSHRKSGQVYAAERADVPERIVAFLRRAHPSKTAECVSAATGISPNTIGKWLDRGSAPSTWATFRLIAAYGPEFACAVMADPPDWLSASARAEEQQRLRSQIAVLEARLDRSAP